jgi:hypothetical protein
VIPCGKSLAEVRNLNGQENIVVPRMHFPLRLIPTGKKKGGD